MVIELNKGLEIHCDWKKDVRLACAGQLKNKSVDYDGKKIQFKQLLLKKNCLKLMLDNDIDIVQDNVTPFGFCH